MFILKEGRTALLNFLRNLTPQAAVFAVAWFLASQLDFNRFDARNWWSTTLFLLSAAVLLAAAWANITLFIEESLDAIEPSRLVIRIARQKHLRQFAKVFMVSRALWRRDRRIFYEWLVTTCVVTVGVLIAFVAGISSAVSTARALTAAH